MGEATYTPKNILITGAARFTTSHVANKLMRTLQDRGVGQARLLLQLEEFVALQVLQEFQVCER
jgi:nucleoside-diphosphate-sugar epimerase